MLLEPPDAETIAMLRRMLASPNEGHQESTIMQALEIADIAASVIWERAGDKTPAERLRLALQDWRSPGRTMSRRDRGTNASPVFQMPAGQVAASPTARGPRQGGD
jgi:hypothetical protein